MTKNTKLNLKYVSDVIGGDYRNWKKGDRILLKSQTGTGKSYFCLNILAPYVKSKYEKILILANRKVLCEQLEKDIPDELENTITVWSYQKLNQMIINNEDMDLNFDYIICDEFHYVVNDSFTGKTHMTFEKLAKEYNPDIIRIYISATFDEIIERRIKKIVKDENMKYYAKDRNLFIYNTGRDYSYLIPNVFTRKETIINKILNDNTQDKWIIFVTNKEQGKDLRESLLDEGISTKFIYSNSNNEIIQNELNNIVLKEKFSTKVLITTAILDNGVNLKDKNIKNIVYFGFDCNCNMIQSIGRVRFDSFNRAYNINLYIQKKTKKSIQAKINVLKKNIKTIESVMQDEENYRKSHRKDLYKIPQYIYLDENDRFKVDILSFYNFKNELKFLQNMLDNYTENIFVEKVCDVLNINKMSIKDIDEEVMENRITKQEDETLSYLQSLIGQELDKQQQEELTQKINIRDNFGRLKKSSSIIKPYLIKNYRIDLLTKRIVRKGKRITVWVLDSL